MCCFDKTGTLTDDSLVLKGIAAVSGDPGGAESVIQVASAPPETIRIMASCHSLIMLEGALAGDPLEKAAFEVSFLRS